MKRFKLSLHFIKRGDTEDVEEVEIYTTSNTINDDVGIVNQTMEERGYVYFRGFLEEVIENG